RFTLRATSCNLLHGTSPFTGFRLMTSNTTNLGASTPVPESGKSLRIPLERTRNGMPRMALISFWAMRVLPPLRAAQLKRWAFWEIRMVTMSNKTRTTVWREEAGGKVRLQTLEGLPFGTEEIIFIPGFGQALKTGSQTSGSAPNETLVEVQYTLKGPV
ncbi:MAG TPA: hypothetical protein VIM34_07285, partial [Burkholderiaceae bacterium]